MTNDAYWMKAAEEWAQASLDMKIMNEVHAVLQKRVEEIRERIVTEAVQKFEKEVRAAVGPVAMNLASYYSLEYTPGGHMVLTVKIGQSS